MDDPMMVMHSHIHQDAGLRHPAGEEVEQQHDNKQHKPVLKKVKDKVKKIKDTIKSHGHGHDHARDDDNRSSSGEEEEEEEEEGYEEDVEDKPIVDPVPEVHGAPMYETTRMPAVQEVEGEDAPRVRLGDLDGPVVEDPAAPQSTSRPPRGGEDIGMTPVVEAFESMAVSRVQPPDTGRQEELKEATVPDTSRQEEPKEATTEATKSASYAEKVKSAAAGTTEYGKKLATAVYGKVAGVGNAVVGKVQQATQTDANVGGGSGADKSSPRGEANEQDKGVSVKEYIVEKLRPGEEDKALSEVIAGAVQRRKEEIGHKVAQDVTGTEGRIPGAQVVEKVRESVTSLTGGGNRETDSVQPTTGRDVKEAGIAVERPELRGQEMDTTTTTTT